MRPGVRIALDIGAKRIGVARCDRDGILAVPLETIAGDDPAWPSRVRALVLEWEPIECIVGDPVSLRGAHETASLAVRERARELAEAIPGTPIRMVDERLSTAVAMRALRASGKDVQQARPNIDAQAAIGILEFALEFERRTGVPAGEAL